MRNANKLKQIEEKIEELRKQQKQLEDDFVADLSTQISKLILKKKLFNIEKSEIISKIESALDEILNAK